MLISVVTCLEDYELVRVHHPDSPQCRDLPANVRRARFQSISHAYDVLRGKQTQHRTRDPVWEELERRRRYSRRADTAFHHGAFDYQYTYSNATKKDFGATGDDRWKDRVIIFVGLVVCVCHAVILHLLTQTANSRWGSGLLRRCFTEVLESRHIYRPQRI